MHVIRAEDQVVETGVEVAGRASGVFRPPMIEPR
jgi:hypothetical protein